MGLDLTHDCWTGAYSAFARFRIALADAAGYPRVETTDPFTPPYWTDELNRMCSEEKLRGYWRKPPADALLILLLHSDCDGYIPAKLCEPLAARLESLLPKLNGDLGGHIGDIKQKTQTFIDGLRRAAAAGERVRFW